MRRFMKGNVTAKVSRQGSMRFFLFAGIISVIGAVFRFLDLSSAPLWMDEAYTVMAARLPISSILFNAIDDNPPLTYLI